MEQSVEQLYRPLFQYVKNRVNNEADAEDLTQDVFYKVAKSDISEISSLKSWVYTVARNTITDYYRKKKVTYDNIEGLSCLTDDRNENAVIRMSYCLEPFINQLPADDQQIMRLSELEGMAQKNIAKQLNMNYATVRSKVQRGRKKLKELFSECCTVTQGGKGSILEIKKRMDYRCCPKETKS